MAALPRHAVFPKRKAGIAINGLLIANGLSLERDSEVTRNERENDEQ